MKILNLGCGTKTSASPNVINIDWSIYLRLKKNPVSRNILKFFLTGHRKHYFQSLPKNILVHDLTKGIPFPDNSVDAVYHSHVFEHIDRAQAGLFLLEVKRVLVPGGVHRMVVPDLEILCQDYLAHLAICSEDDRNYAQHDKYIADIIEQCVRRESFGSQQQPPLQRFIENLWLGDARKRGETHQWMYDRVNLTYLLSSAGYRDITVHQYNTSAIPNWDSLGLDHDGAGKPHILGSLYLEANKP